MYDRKPQNSVKQLSSTKKLKKKKHQKTEDLEIDYCKDILWAELHSPKKIIEVLTLSTSECDLTWK